MFVDRGCNSMPLSLSSLWNVHIHDEKRSAEPQNTQIQKNNENFHFDVMFIPCVSLNAVLSILRNLQGSLKWLETFYSNCTGFLAVGTRACRRFGCLPPANTSGCLVFRNPWRTTSPILKITLRRFRLADVSSLRRIFFKIN